MTPGSTPTIVVKASLVQPSNSETLSTAASQISQLLKPATPINLQSSNILSDSFTLSWTTSLGADTYYLSLDNGVTYPFTATVVPGEVQTFDFSALETGTNHSVKVKAENAIGVAESTTYDVLTRPAAPINIRTTNVTQTGFTINWTASVGATDYSIDVNGAGYIQLANVTTYIVTGLNQGSTNSIQLKANNQSGSTEAAPLNFKTKPSTPLLQTPSVTDSTPTTVDITWTGGDGATTYIFLVNGKEVIANPTDYTSNPRTATLTGLLPSVSYDIVIIATNSGGSSPSTTAFSGIVLWLDAADPGATLTNGQSLTTWYDKSGYNNDATASGTITYQATSINGYPAMTLTGSQALTGNISIATNQLTVLAVYVMNNTSDDMDEQGIIYNVIAPITQHAHDVDNDKYKAIEQSTVHSDATGRFPIRSKTGNEYVMTTVYNGYIYLHPMQNRSTEQQIKAYQATSDHFKQQGHNVKY
jgi:hypothetical protein